MKRSVSTRWVGVLVLFTLAGCGGGGSSSPSPSPAPTPTLSFAPATLAENTQFGQVGTGTLGAVISSPEAITGELYVQVSGTDGVFSTDWSLAQVDDSHYSITLHSLASLAVGHHTGQATVSMCRDVQCRQPYPGGPAAFAYDIDVEPAPLHATPTTPATSTAHWGAADDDVVSIAVEGDGLQWTATTTASWLMLDKAAGTGPATLQASYLTTTALAVGDYSDTVTVASEDGQSVKVPFTLHVLPAAFELLGGVPSFNAVNGAPIAAQAVSFDVDTGASSAWTLASDASWLSVTASGLATPGSAMLQPDPSIGALASGAYTAHLQLGDGSSGNVTGKSFASNLTLVKPTLSTSVPTITLGGPRGRDLSAQSLTLALDTDANAYPWAASGRPAWLATTASGTVSHGGTPLTFTPAASAASPGSTSAVMTYTATVNGDAVNAPMTVNFNLDQRRLLPSTWGVGLASSPTGTVLTRTITMRDNFGGNVAWTASSDKAWLSVTSSGDTGGSASLVVTADPTLAPAGTSVATVMVVAAATGTASARIAVGLWKDATGLPALVKTSISGTSALAADKIRPNVYANEDGQSITVYNAYRATKVATIANVGTALNHMAVSPDGSRLYVLDSGVGNSTSGMIQVIDLSTRQRIATWHLGLQVDLGTPIVVTRPNGVEVVLLGITEGSESQVSTAYGADGRPLGTTGIELLVTAHTAEQMAASDDGASLYTLDGGLGIGKSVTAWDIDYSEIAGGTLFVARRGGVQIDGGRLGADIAVGSAGNLYVSGMSGADCQSIDIATLTPRAALPAATGCAAVEGLSDGRVVSADGNGMLLRTFSPSGALLGSISSPATYWTEKLVVTPDSLVAVVETGDPWRFFVPIGP